MLRFKSVLSVAIFLWLGVILFGCSQPMINMEGDEHSPRRREADSSAPNNIVASGNALNAAVMNSPHDIADGRVAGGVVNNEGAFVHVAAQSGQDASVDDQESGAASGRAAIASQQQQSPPYPIVYGGYRAFGAQAWYNYFGVDVGTEPALPDDIASILNEEAPFMLESEASPQRVGDNHLLTLIPSHVKLPDGRRVPFTLDQLGELAKERYFPNNAEGYKYYDLDVHTHFGAASSNKSYWLLMTHDVLQGTRDKTYAEQQELVAKYSSQGWEVPSGLEAATSILACYTQSGKHKERLFGDCPWAFTRCTPKQLIGGEYSLVVGGFGPSGLAVIYDDYEVHYHGVACCRKLSNRDDEGDNFSIDAEKPALIDQQHPERSLLAKPLAKTPGAALLAIDGGYRAFGAQAWYDYFGVDVGSEPALPGDIVSILNEEAPFMLDSEVSPQCVGANHLLTLIPSHVTLPDGSRVPFTLNQLGALSKERYFPNNVEGYDYYSSAVCTQYGVASPDKSYWLLMTCDLLQGTRAKTYAEQQKVVAKYSSQGWELPSGLEAATSILACYAQSDHREERLFGDKPLTFTRCTSRQLIDGRSSLVVGGFGPAGLYVHNDSDYAYDDHGVACCRKLSNRDDEGDNFSIDAEKPALIDQPASTQSRPTKPSTKTSSDALLAVGGGYHAFGAQAWKDCFGVDVGTEPTLPGDIVSILNEEAPFMLESEASPQRVGANHLLTFIPSHVTLPDGRRVPFTLNQLGELVRERYFPNNAEGYRYYDSDIRIQFGAASPNKSYWLLMTHDVLQGTRYKTYAKQRKMVKQYSSKGWELPSGIEAATSILACYAQSGNREERLFGDRPWTYTRCTLRQLVGGSYSLAVGSFEPAGLAVRDSCFDFSDFGRDFGVACCRKLPNRDDGGDNFSIDAKKPALIDQLASTQSRPAKALAKTPGAALLAIGGGYWAFGAQAWYDYFGVDVGNAPALPGDIVSILNEEAPFMLDSEVSPQCVGTNHLLTLIPSHVTLPNGRCVPFTLDQLGVLVKEYYFPNNVEGYDYHSSAVRTQYGAVSPKKSYWLLMTRDVLQGTRAKTYAEQQEVVEKYSSQGWELPSGLEAATSILACYAQSGNREERLFGDSPWTFTRCTPKQLIDGEYPLAVGGFGPAGLYVYGSNYVSSFHGVACCRKLPNRDDEGDNLSIDAKKPALIDQQQPKLSLLGKPSAKTPGAALLAIGGGYCAFGAQAWYDYFGVDVGTEPTLPYDIVSILNEKAPFMLDREASPQRVGVNHLLTLIPSHVKLPNGCRVPFTLNKLGALVKERYFPNNEKGYRLYYLDVRTQYGATSPNESYWLLMTRDVLQGTRDKTYAEQQELVAKYSSQGWELPSGIEATTSILARYAQSGHRQERLFGDSPWTYTRCTSDQLVGGKYPLAIGGFGPAGLHVYGSYDYDFCVGVACCRKFD
ncbi:MAG: hypothetical protein ACX93T_00915 [Bacteroidota bacterium]